MLLIVEALAICGWRQASSEQDERATMLHFLDFVTEKQHRGPLKMSGSSPAPEDTDFIQHDCFVAEAAFVRRGMLSVPNEEVRARCGFIHNSWLNSWLLTTLLSSGLHRVATQLITIVQRDTHYTKVSCLLPSRQPVCMSL